MTYYPKLARRIDNICQRVDRLDRPRLFMVMLVNSGRDRKIVEGRSLAEVQRRFGLNYLVQPVDEAR